MKVLRVLSTLAATLLMYGAAQAQVVYPSQPIRLVIPFGPGGGTDIAARKIGQRLSERLGVPVVAENKPGANGNIAAEYLLRAPADGNTLLYNTSSLAISPALYRKLSYDMRTDLAPVIRTAEIPLVLVVSPSVPATTLKEFVDYLQANSGKVFYASAGNGNISHLAAALFLETAGATAVHVPFTTGGQALMSTAAGDTQFFFDTTSSAGPLAKAGKVRALAVTTLARAPSIPDVPTLSEALLPGFNIPVWQGIVVSGKTPPAIISRLNAELNKVLQDKQLLMEFAAQDTTAVGGSSEDYATYLSAEYSRWMKIVKRAGVKID